MSVSGKIALFLGGTLFGSAGLKILSGRDARKVYTHTTAAVLRCRNELAGVIIDRFGTEISIVPEDGGYFHVHVTVAVSPQFYGWVTGIGAGIEISSPREVRSGYREYLQGILSKY